MKIFSLLSLSALVAAAPAGNSSPGFFASLTKAPPDGLHFATDLDNKFADQWYFCKAFIVANAIAPQYQASIIDEANRTGNEILRKIHHPVENEFWTSRNEMKDLEKELPNFKDEDKKKFLEFMHMPYTKEMGKQCRDFVHDKAPGAITSLGGLPW